MIHDPFRSAVPDLPCDPCAEPATFDGGDHELSQPIPDPSVFRSRSGVVSQIFEGAGPFYDEIVDMATRGEDRRWKEKLIGLLEQPRRVLDLACGTGILTFMIRDRFPCTEVVGVDITPSLLDVAKERARAQRDHMVRFLLGAAEEVDCDGPFDAVVSCYLPKYADLPRLVSRLPRLLVPGGVFVVQDFTYPEQPEIRQSWHRRFEELRRWVREHRPEAQAMFELLPAVIRESDWLTSLPSLLTAAGFEEGRILRQTCGTSAIVSGRLPRGSSAPRPPVVRKNSRLPSEAPGAHPTGRH